MIKDDNQSLTSNEEQNDTQNPPDADNLWQLDESALAAKYATDPENGLSTAEAAERLQHNGRNELETKRTSRFVQFIKQFNNSIIYILAAAAVLTFFMLFRFYRYWTGYYCQCHHWLCPRTPSWQRARTDS